MPKRLPILKTFVNPENDPATQEQALQAILVLVKSDQLRWVWNTDKLTSHNDLV